MPHNLETMVMATAAQSTLTTKIYSLCVFPTGGVVPEVTLIEADTDEEAICMAQETGTLATREVWDRHRLVAVLKAAH